MGTPLSEVPVHALYRAASALLIYYYLLFFYPHLYASYYI